MGKKKSSKTIAEITREQLDKGDIPQTMLDETANPKGDADDEQQ